MAQAVPTSFLALGFTILNCWFIYFSFAPHKADLVAQFDIIRSTNSSSSSSSSSAANVSEPTPVVLTPKEEDPPVSQGACDVSNGRWVPDTRPPLYTNETCEYIHPNQNCMKNKRPDLGYLNWRWQPNGDGCQLPDFSPSEFLNLVRNKRLAFIGDSLGRNHMQSLLCALVQVEKPEMIGHFKYSDLEEWWRFPIHNFTLRNIWTPFFIKYTVDKEIFKLQLDVMEDVWASHLDDYDIAVLGIGYWFFRPSVYYLNKMVIGCNSRSGLNFSTMDEMLAFRMVHQRALQYMVDRFKGVVILRTITVDHFEHGSWDGGGLCNRTGPFEDTSLELPWVGSQMYRIQAEEFSKAVEEGRGDLSRFKLLNVSFSSFLRPDGHPSFYRVQKPNARPQYDCLHWCLPGPIDMWNQIILSMLRSSNS